MDTYEFRLVCRGLFLAVPGGPGEAFTLAFVDAREPEEDGLSIAHVCGLEFEVDNWVNREVQETLNNLTPEFQKETGDTIYRFYAYERQRIELDCIEGVFDPDPTDPSRSRGVDLLRSFADLVALDSIAPGSGRVRQEVLTDGEDCVALMTLTTGGIGSERRSTIRGMPVRWAFVPAEGADDNPAQDAQRVSFNLDLVATFRVPLGATVRVRSSQLPNSTGEESELHFRPRLGDHLTLHIKNRELDAIMAGTDTIDLVLAVDRDFEWLYRLVEEPGERLVPTSLGTGGAPGGTGCGGSTGSR